MSVLFACMLLLLVFIVQSDASSKLTIIQASMQCAIWKMANYYYFFRYNILHIEALQIWQHFYISLYYVHVNNLYADMRYEKNSEAMKHKWNMKHVRKDATVCKRKRRRKRKNDMVQHYNIEHQREKVIFNKLLPFLNNFIFICFNNITNCTCLKNNTNLVNEL